MVFNSLTFVVFFACVLLLHSMPFNWTTKKVNLLIASYLFYASGEHPNAFSLRESRTCALGTLARRTSRANI